MKQCASREAGQNGFPWTVRSCAHVRVCVCMPVFQKCLRALFLGRAPRKQYDPNASAKQLLDISEEKLQVWESWL